MFHPAARGQTPRALCWALAIAVCFAVRDGTAAPLGRSLPAQKHRSKKLSKSVKKRAGPPTGPPSRSREPAGSSPRVIYVTTQRAYLNAGRASGLAVGATVPLMRRGRNVAVCQVDAVGEHQASCIGKGIRPGDSFALANGEKQEARSVDRAPMPSAAELDRRLAAVTSAPYPQVDYQDGGGGNAIRRSGSAEVGLGHTSWVGAHTDDGTFLQERLWVALRGVSLSPSLRLYVDALALHWTQRPIGFRFPIQASNQLFVHQAEVSSREIGESLAFSAGRIWPVHTPGVGTLDGAQLGWRSRRGELEGGLFAGAIPDPVTLAPGTMRPLIGSYFAAEQSSSSGPLRFAREEVRASLAHRSDLGWRGELESSAISYWRRNFDVAADARLAVGHDSSLAFEAARFSLGFHSAGQLHLFAAARYLSTPPMEVPDPGDSLSGTRSLHGDASINWLPAGWISLAAILGHAKDLNTSLHHTFAGPEIGFPRLLGNHASVALGYQGEVGDYSGKTAYLQLIASPYDRLRLIERISWFENSISTASPATYEGGLFSSIDWAIAKWLSLRGSVLGRLSLDSVETTSGSTRPSGIIISASASGEF